MTGVDELLAQIDHALEDYDTSADAMRWTPEQSSDRQVSRRPQYATVMFNVDWSGFNAAIERCQQQLRAAMPLIAKAIRQVETARASHAQQPVDETDPRAHVLWLRQHRNTGPAARRLDGRRAR